MAAGATGVEAARDQPAASCQADRATPHRLLASSATIVAAVASSDGGAAAVVVLVHRFPLVAQLARG